MATFLQGYESSRGQPFTGPEQRVAAAAAAWIIAFNARWQLGLGDDRGEARTALWFVRERPDDYLALAW
ncbi:hypothetical protein [Microlunatus sp. Gsoil 973]|uniref:hypothetical protein n=1 Tax=Microlunatus sp. Gsoil 973 TaxID=2672569 RepID=UPI0012B4C083|nr:hypothetical protein [Microlunatus sp. Gsoil 973]QGN32513.1 hypothetical protein GJV80_06530 [Microlunatus sp. Gsoil 973]